jgi:hypothetical protein
MNRRGLRLELVAGLGIALWMPALAVVAAQAQSGSTTTTLTAGSLSGCDQTLAISVTAGGQPASGIVAIDDEFNGSEVQLGSAQLNSSGAANPTIALASGSHTLTAVFAGSSSGQDSTSSPINLSIPSGCSFMAAVSNLAPATNPVNTLTPGQSGTATVSIIPSPGYTATLTAPTFVTLSCSGLPDQASCSVTPQSVELLPTTTTPPTSSMVIQTLAVSTTSSLPSNRPGKGSSPINWAFLLPGALVLGGLGWGARRRRWLKRISLMALVCLATLMGTTACNPRWYYLNHGPFPNPPTPAGTYAVTVTAQSSNGVTAITQTTTFALTVK